MAAARKIPQKTGINITSGYGITTKKSSTTPKKNPRVNGDMIVTEEKGNSNVLGTEYYMMKAKTSGGGSSKSSNKNSYAKPPRATKPPRAPAAPKPPKEVIDYTPLIEMYKKQTADSETQERTAHAQRMQALENMYNENKAHRDKNYNYNVGVKNDENAEIMRKLYIESMLAKRNNAQSLAAQGLSGGFSQSEEMGLQRNYENRRLDAQNQNKRYLEQLSGAYAQQNGSANTAYEAEKANLSQALSKSLAQLQDELLKILAKYNSF